MKKPDLYTKIVLTAIALFLGIIVAKDIDFVTKAHASDNSQQTVKVEKEEIVYSNNFDPDTDLYTSDRKSVYFNGIKITGARASSFEVLADGYAEDDSKVYYKGKSVYGVVPPFNVLGGNYGKGVGGSFYKGKKVENADPYFFKVLN